MPQAALSLPDGVHDGVEAVAAAPLALFGCDALGGHAKPVVASEEQSVDQVRSTSKANRGDYASKSGGPRMAKESPPRVTASAEPAAAPSPAPPGLATPTDESTASMGRIGGGAGGGSGGRTSAIRIRGAEEGKLAKNRPGPAGRPFAQPPRPARELRDPFHGGRDKAKAEHESDDRDADNEARNARAANLLASLVPVDYCSDASRRSLAHRRALWANQLDQAGNLAGWIAVYRRAQAHCEVPHQRDRHELLDLIQLRVTTPAEVGGLLAAVPDPKSQDFVRRQLLRRAVTPEMASRLRLRRQRQLGPRRGSAREDRRPGEARRPSCARSAPSTRSRSAAPSASSAPSSPPASRRRRSPSRSSCARTAAPRPR